MSEARAVPALAWPSDATLQLPGSKSSANRLLIAAAISGRHVTVHGASPSDDVRHLVAGLRTLGFELAFDEAAASIAVGPRGANAPASGTLHCGNAGTALRFLVSVAAITPGEWTITGDEAMQRRPIAPLVAAWQQLGVDITDTNGNPPVHVRGSAQVRGGDVQLEVSQSSQFLSSLLLVGAHLPAGLRVRFDGDLASAQYAQMTVAALRTFGVVAHIDHDGASVQPGFGGVPATVRADGDWSSAGVWLCLDELTGSRVAMPTLARNSGQPDEQLVHLLRTWSAPGELTLDVRAMPDQFLNLAIVAAYRDGTTRVLGGENQRIKECDRIHVMARELTRLGVDLDELPDGLLVRGGTALRAATIDPANDHRIAMAFALAGMLSPGIHIADPDCVSKSYPSFWRDLEQVVAQRRCVAVVGMRAAGKTTFARAFAAATGVVLHDTDADFVAEHGPIAAFVATHGWPAFREHEARFVADAVHAGRIVSTGGGAIENENTRRLLRRRAFIVWLDAPTALLRERLANDPVPRPSLTGAAVADELDAVLAQRQPLYAAVADVRIDAAMPTSQQVALVQRALAATCRWPGNG